MCDQQSLRSACAYAQSDQSLCYSLEYFMSVKLLTEHHLEFLCFKGGCTVSFESTVVKMPHCWKSHALAHTVWLRNNNFLFTITHSYLEAECIAVISNNSIVSQVNMFSKSAVTKITLIRPISRVYTHMFILTPLV